MKKLLSVLLCLALFLVACGNNDSNKNDSQDKSSHKQSTTKTFTTENGKKLTCLRILSVSWYYIQRW